MGWIDKAIERWPASVKCAFWVVVSGLLTSTQLGIVKLIANDLNVFEIVLFRAGFSLLFLAPLVMGNARVLLRPIRWGICLLCGALAFAANVFFTLPCPICRSPISQRFISPGHIRRHHGVDLFG